jgi:hypothetical protein
MNQHKQNRLQLEPVLFVKVFSFACELKHLLYDIFNFF